MKLHRFLIVSAAGALLLYVAATFLRPDPVSDYLPIVQQVNQGALSAQKTGVVRLPKAFAGITPRDEVYVEKKSDGRIFILFPTWYGRGTDIEGYLYCNQTLLPSDYYSYPWGTGKVSEYTNVAGRDMLTVEYYKPNWYWVTKRLD